MVGSKAVTTDTKLADRRAVLLVLQKVAEKAVMSVDEMAVLLVFYLVVS